MRRYWKRWMSMAGACGCLWKMETGARLFAVYLSLLAEGRIEEANKACKEALSGLIEHYLAKN